MGVFNGTENGKSYYCSKYPLPVTFNFKDLTFVRIEFIMGDYSNSVFNSSQAFLDIGHIACGRVDSYHIGTRTALHFLTSAINPAS